MEVDGERVTRLVCIFISYGNKNKGSPPSSRRRQRSSALQLIFRAVVTQIKKKQMHCICFFFMERVTRLELATSTLARWRSTG